MRNRLARRLLSATLSPALPLVLALAPAFLVGCASETAEVGRLAYTRQGDEIMVAGQLFHTGAPVVLWTDPGGYDAYRTEKRFAPVDKSSWEATTKDGKGPDSPARYSPRFMRFAEKQPVPWPLTPETALSEAQIASIRGGGMDLPTLQSLVDQFVLHYDVCGTSRTCFRILHDVRGLSVHFMLDIDGTIYQTLDLRERAYHATSSNDRSVGIEIANMGAYAEGEKSPLGNWYKKDSTGRTIITLPDYLGDGGIRTPRFVGSPDRPEPIVGPIQGKARTQYDLTPQQYTSLVRLTAALGRALPKINMDFPRDDQGRLITAKLPDPRLKAYTGILGHYHIQDDKADPGPAIQWDRIISEARYILDLPALPPGAELRPADASTPAAAASPPGGTPPPQTPSAAPATPTPPAKAAPAATPTTPTTPGPTRSPF